MITNPPLASCTTFSAFHTASVWVQMCMLIKTRILTLLVLNALYYTSLALWISTEKQNIQFHCKICNTTITRWETKTLPLPSDLHIRKWAKTVTKVNKSYSIFSQMYPTVSGLFFHDNIIDKPMNDNMLSIEETLLIVLWTEIFILFISEITASDKNATYLSGVARLCLLEVILLAKSYLWHGYFSVEW